jgi:serine/threonine protein kinase
MEYIKGKSLEDILKDRTKPFEEEKALRLGIQICEILCYLHNLSPEPVIYRDLKPSNIIVTGEDRLRLIDFGVVRRYDPDKDCDTVRLGTPGYAAPEQCRKKGQSIPQSDIYARGVVLHQLLTLYDPSVTHLNYCQMEINPAVPEQMEILINKIFSYRNGLKRLTLLFPTAILL